MLNPGKSLMSVKKHFTDQDIDSYTGDELEEIEARAVAEEWRETPGPRPIGTLLSVVVDLSTRAISLISLINMTDEQREGLNNAAKQIRDIVLSLADQEDI
jgi:hypothetical protein